MDSMNKMRTLTLSMLIFSMNLTHLAAASPVRPPLLTVPKLSPTPQIDGNIASAEWQDAAVMDGFEVLMTGAVPRDRTRAWVGYDDQKLYIAVQCWVPPVLGIKADAKERDGMVFMDDAVEIFAGGRQFVGNSIGAKLDAMNSAPAWDADWDYAARPTEFGWEAEFAFPFASLGRGTPQPGDTMELMIGRDAARPDMEYSQWGYYTTYWPSQGQSGHILFAERTARLVVTELQNRSLTPALRAEAVAPAEADAEFDLDCVLRRAPRRAGAGEAKQSGVMLFDDPSGGQILAKTSARVRLAAGQRAPLAVPAVPLEVGQFVLELSARQPDGRTFFSQHFPLEHIPRLRADVRRFPTAGRLELDLRAAVAAESQRAKTARVALTNEADQPVWSDRRPYGETLRFDGYGALPPGRYRLRLGLVDEQGQILAEDVQPLIKSPPPLWLNTSLGKEDTVIAPWTPVKRVGRDTVAVWARRYRFGGNGLPIAITADGVELLDAPVELVAESDGQPLRFIGGRRRIESTATRAIVRTTARAVDRKDVRLETTTTVEFDGFAWTELTLRGPQGFAVDKLWLEVPLRADVARYRLPVFNDPVAIPAEGLQAPVVPVTDWGARRTTGLWWVGDEDRGLSLSAEDDRTWRPRDRAKAVELQRAGGRVVWRLHLADSRLEIGAERTFTFCWQATPVKPVKLWYAHRVVGDGVGVDGLEKKYPRPVWVRWPAAKLINPAQGVLEIDAVCLFDWDAPEERQITSANNRSFFHLDLAGDGGLTSFWAADARTLAVCERYGQTDRSRMYGTWRPVKGQPFRLSFAWGDEQRLWIDGQEIGRAPVKGLAGLRPGARLTVGGEGRSQWLILGVRLGRKPVPTLNGPLSSAPDTVRL
ncbi:MAG: hypothetical protein HY646_16170, partial [Acidobacteria bacterium]|nr:hypothetical protein [Acidobacteriota bacterium]